MQYSLAVLLCISCVLSQSADWVVNFNNNGACGCDQMSTCTSHKQKALAVVSQIDRITFGNNESPTHISNWVSLHTPDAVVVIHQTDETTTTLHGAAAYLEYNNQIHAAVTGTIAIQGQGSSYDCSSNELWHRYTSTTTAQDQTVRTVAHAVLYRFSTDMKIMYAEHYL
eukprot:TRINITY_DN25327_c0_g1_i1.p1 TRINITY_DN25327_c0_g1~~TRINITY_DN25327_c0_g1_i1.p1  ORF type:complete len:169 (-),score=28.92 TRINITY_DN25327_c0_g1_i1:300-806(-)